MKIHLLLCFFITSALCFAQNESSTAFFGNLGIDFRPPVPQVISPIEMISKESSTYICDENGDILFYTNGGTSATAPGTGAIWNADHDIMENGLLEDSSGCFSAHQGAIVVPFPSNDLKIGSKMYYLFTKDCIESSFASWSFNSGLTYSVIDMAANGGLGAVLHKNVSAVPFEHNQFISTNHEPVTAILHGNQTDYWLFSYTKDSLYRLIVDDSGVGSPEILFPAGGRISIAPDREHMCLGRDIYQFDAYTGDLLYLTSIPGVAGTVAFSPNGRKLYNNENGSLFQYDLNQTDILASKTQIASLGYIYSMWLAPNHKIYLQLGNDNHFDGEIRCPNETGAACDFTLQELPLGAYTYGGFPNIMAHLLYYNGSCVANLSENLDLDHKVELLKVVNLMGQEVDGDATGTLLFQYSDGNVIKIYR
ncbi:hypothetical protein N9355_04025 [Crocinitomicaceae bacterium]|nr:hypothetical protein [Crocinitomicaceae bacterium]